jgi:serine/threonine protein kinase
VVDAYEALKVVHIPPLGEQGLRDVRRAEAFGRIKREIEALKQCAEPQLVRLGSIQPRDMEIEGNDYVIYSEEFLHGSNLHDIIRSESAFPAERELCLLFLSLLRAIRALWIHGYIHRDIKPANVIKNDDAMRPFVLLDLGIAFSVRDTALTYDPGSRLPPATYRYIAPEMLQSDFRDTLDYRSDLYSAALTVYEYATKRHALARDGDDLMTTLSRALTQPATPLERIRSDLSPNFCKYINRLLHKKPALRPARLDNIITDLETMQ